MIVPCMVNSWLYCSGDRNWSPGGASSAGMIGAMTPPTRKKTNEVTRYIRPICFASVVRSSRAMAEPLIGWCTGQGRVTIGFGATVVTYGLLRLVTDRTGDRCRTSEAEYPSATRRRSEEHTSELQSQSNLVCRLLLEKKKYR